MAVEQAIRDGSQVTSLLVTNASETTSTLRVYGDPNTHGIITSSVAYSGTPTLSNVSVSASNFTVVSSSATRKSLVVVNDGSANVYVKLGTTATTSSYSYKLPAGTTLALPEPNAPMWTGQIDAIGDAATGTLRVTSMA